MKEPINRETLTNHIGPGGWLFIATVGIILFPLLLLAWMYPGRE
jgi:hypothetical protein